jgi:Ni,Fe-hydrogenase III component G
MNREQRLSEAIRLLAPWIDEPAYPEPHRLDVIVPAEELLDAVGRLLETPWGYLSTITGLDLGVEEGKLELLYHFSSGAVVVTLRVRTPRDKAAVPSICGFIPSASVYERELSEMLGVSVENTPNPDRLFLPDEWPAGVFPLRKDFEPESVG